ncbi:MAG: hypothetical protein ACD_4C00179G0003 [uncultured bacterium (gcode 4)]|uniref:Uncharacterized protein n=1 Tax=uncultured bacterium (gcode 4) TaxID=1234023 RepID=K2F6L8_9BACT|nr:MAG: hypothetical protein ACD_4C00179G0003 [uncultured bacterium (gcode 4)]
MEIIQTHSDIFKKINGQIDSYISICIELETLDSKESNMSAHQDAISDEIVEKMGMKKITKNELKAELEKLKESDLDLFTKILIRVFKNLENNKKNEIQKVLSEIRLDNIIAEFNDRIMETIYSKNVEFALYEHLKLNKKQEVLKIIIDLLKSKNNDSLESFIKEIEKTGNIDIELDWMTVYSFAMCYWWFEDITFLIDKYKDLA